MIRFVLLYSRQGHVRLVRWFDKCVPALKKMQANAASTSRAASAGLSHHGKEKPFTAKDKARIIHVLLPQIVARDKKMCNFVDFALPDVQTGGQTNVRVVYRRYAGLWFCVGCDGSEEDNELTILEFIQQYVESLDLLFGGGVCELDILYAQSNALQLLDEWIIGGYLHESDKRMAVAAVQLQDECEQQEEDAVYGQGTAAAKATRFAKDIYARVVGK